MIKSNDKRIRELQLARDKTDEKLCSTAWFGPLVSKYKSQLRAESLDQCHILVIRESHNYPTLSFVVGDGNNTIYGSQQFYLRNQWDRGGDYWRGDAGIHGILSTEELLESEEVQKLANEASANTEDELPGITMTPFTEEEHDVIQECVVPFVMRLDEAFSGEGRSVEDLGYKLGKDKERGQSFRGNRSWQNEVKGVDRTLKLRMFKALQLLSIHAF